jgi:hypothetical protein
VGGDDRSVLRIRVTAGDARRRGHAWVGDAPARVSLTPARHVTFGARRLDGLTLRRRQHARAILRPRRLVAR